MSRLDRLKRVFGGEVTSDADRAAEAIKKYDIRVYPMPLPLTAEQAARIPTSLLLTDVMWHYPSCGGKCEHCRPKFVEIDTRLPVRDASLMNLESKGTEP